MTEKLVFLQELFNKDKENASVIHFCTRVFARINTFKDWHLLLEKVDSNIEKVHKPHYRLGYYGSLYKDNVSCLNT